MDRFSLLGKVLRGITGKGGLYRFGESIRAGASPAEIADHYQLKLLKSEPDMVTFGRGSDPESNASIRFYPTRKEWNEEVGEETMKSPLELFEKLEAIGPRSAVSDIDTIAARGGGSQYYRALYDVNRERNARNASGLLTADNRMRRTENMLSALMHDSGGGRRILIDPSQRVANSDGEQLTPSEFMALSPEEQIGALAAKALGNTERHVGGLTLATQPSLMSRRYLDNALEDAAMLADALPRPKTAWDGRLVGESTVRRAALTRGILDDLEGGADESAMVDTILNLDHPYFNGLFYREGGRVA